MKNCSPSLSLASERNHERMITMARVDRKKQASEALRFRSLFDDCCKLAAMLDSQINECSHHHGNNK